MKLRIFTGALLLAAVLQFTGCSSTANTGGSADQQTRPPGSGGRGTTPGMAAETGVTGPASR